MWLKEIHLFDSDISGEALIGYLRQIRNNSTSHKWTYPSQLHLSGCLNITLTSRSELEDEGDYYAFYAVSQVLNIYSGVIIS